jgi:hypothetical protein
MPALYYGEHEYPPAYHNEEAASSQNVAQAKEEDTEQAASLLLLLGRAVTPEPQLLDDSDHSQARQAHYQSYSQHYPARSYASPYPEQTHRQAMTTTPGVDLTKAMPPSSSSVNNFEASLNYEALIEDSELVVMKDRDLVPDSLFVAMAQMKPCRLNHADRVGCYKNRDLGFLGMCCKHCGGQPGFGRYYPNSVRSLAQTTTSQTILKHIGNKCRFAPPHVRNAVLQLQQQSSLCEGMTSGRPRYGSRKIFFQRIWARLHKGATFQEDDEDDTTDEHDDRSSERASEETPTDVDESSALSSEEETSTGTKAKRKRRFGDLPLQKNKKRAKTTNAHGSSLAVAV